jgi:hypothetical protein
MRPWEAWWAACGRRSTGGCSRWRSLGFLPDSAHRCATLESGSLPSPRTTAARPRPAKTVGAVDPTDWESVGGAAIMGTGSSAAMARISASASAMSAINISIALSGIPFHPDRSQYGSWLTSFAPSSALICGPTWVTASEGGQPFLPLHPLQPAGSACPSTSRLQSCRPLHPILCTAHIYLIELTVVWTVI